MEIGKLSSGHIIVIDCSTKSLKKMADRWRQYPPLLKQIPKTWILNYKMWTHLNQEAHVLAYFPIYSGERNLWKTWLKIDIVDGNERPFFQRVQFPELHLNASENLDQSLAFLVLDIRLERLQIRGLAM